MGKVNLRSAALGSGRLLVGRGLQQPAYVLASFVVCKAKAHELKSFRALCWKLRLRNLLKGENMHNSVQ